MNIVFFGSSRFAVPSLKALVNSPHKILCVVTQPDKKSGRHLRMEVTPVKEFARKSGLEIFSPQSVNSSHAELFLKSLAPDLFIVIAYGQILSSKLLALPKFFSLNAHASLLPKYRGAAPINWSIISGDNETGVSVMKMVEKMDAGPIILQQKCGIAETDTAVTLEEKLSQIAAVLITESLELVGENRYNLTAQDETKVSLAPKLRKEDGLVDWGKSARDIYNLIRGAQAWPGAFTYYKGKLLKIYKARVVSQGPQAITKPGEIIDVSNIGITAAAGKSYLTIEELQIEAKRRMSAAEFIAGHKFSAGEIFGKI
ncbi:MAG: methionyl-tRNA formyltransferase [Candidatus Omnitrophota bacterium]